MPPEMTPLIQAALIKAAYNMYFVDSNPVFNGTPNKFENLSTIARGAMTKEEYEAMVSFVSRC